MRFRRILLAAAGLSPQVITETLFVLAVRRDPSELPDEVHLVTTQEGAERARLSLLSEDPGWFRRFLQEYELPQIKFDESCLHLLHDLSGSVLSDIRTGSDNQAAADAVADLVRHFTSDPGTAVHISIAGGRKTLGFFLGYALSLFGRPQDCLTHVLVSPPFESHPEFFYPTRRSRIIYTPQPDSKPLDTSTAQVDLAEIPFVLLREWLPPDALQHGVSFLSAVRAAQQRLGPPRLVLHLDRRTIQAAGVSVNLAPAEMAFLAWLARRAQAGLEPVPCPSDGAPEPELAAAFLAEYNIVAGVETEIGARTRATLSSGMEKSFFQEHKTRLNRALKDALGAQAGPYLIQPRGRRPNTGFLLALEPSQIVFSPTTESSV